MSDLFIKVERLLKYMGLYRQYMNRLRAKALALGADNFKPSTRKGKKYMVLYDGKTIHFGASGMSDFTIHKDKERRARYRARHGKIKLKNGRLAYTVRSSPAYWSWHILW
jgi:hypothetical protein